MDLDYKARDAYFTRPHVARMVWAMALRHCRANGLDPADLHWLEPSAGAGVFLKHRPARVKTLTAFDIEPLGEGIERKDFLHTFRWDFPADKPLVVIGNPPFGFRSTLVKRFVEKAIIELGARFATFVTPGMMGGAFMMSRLAGGIRVRRQRVLDGNAAFELPDGRRYKLGSAARIITFEPGARLGARLGATSHPDFDLFATRERSACIATMQRRPNWVCAIHQATGRLLPANEPDPDSLEGIGRHILVWSRPGRIDAETLYNRFAQIDWREEIRKDSADEKRIPDISVHGLVRAYTARFGNGLSPPPNQHRDFTTYSFVNSPGAKCGRRAEGVRKMARNPNPACIIMINRNEVIAGSAVTQDNIPRGSFIVCWTRNGLSNETLFERMRAIDWSATMQMSRRNGNARGTIAPWMVVHEYAQRWGQ